MEAKLTPKLGLEEVLPDFRLPSSRGREIELADYRQRRNLVLFFFHSGACETCRVLLKEFAEHYDEYEKLNAEVLAVSADAVGAATELATELALPFPVLADTEGKFFNRCTYPAPGMSCPSPSVMITDRYGAIYDQWVAAAHDRLPTQKEILSTLSYIEMQCPECGI